LFLCVVAKMKIGVLTLGDWMADPATGVRLSQRERFDAIVTLAQWAEEFGFDSFHIGEHHFCDYIVSNPVPLLSAAAMRTARISLSTAVTLLANRDPVLIAEDYAALDVLSGGRAEIVAGRGNLFLDCYRQFGQDLGQSRATFDGNLDLLIRLWTEDRVSSDGATRPPLSNARIQPRPVQQPHPWVWVGGGSSPESASAAASRGLPFQLPGVFAGAAFFKPLADAYRAEFTAGALGPAARQVGYTAHCHVAADGDAARAFWEPYHIGYLHWVNAIVEAGGLRGPKPSFARNVLDPAHHTALCGSPDEIAGRILRWRDTLGGLDRLLLKFDGGGLPMSNVRAAMELFADKVRPRIG
jgi:alkanesulfonate monooxygenase SsuD/methylene tetrahydromethanopterin reductase-like flavin-dependent oxidoreductase (luciferase family)